MEWMLNVVLFAVAVFMMYRVILLNGRNKKARAVIDIVNSVDDIQLFHEKTEAMINGKDHEFSVKAQVLKLWGMAYHNQYRNFDEVLDQTDVDALIGVKKGRTDIEQNEDTFFYLYLAIGNILEGNRRRDLRKRIDEKMKKYEDRLQNQFVCQLHHAVTDFYDHEGDRGMAFFKAVLDGDYGQYRYSKSLIGLYKSIAVSHLAVLYKEDGKMDQFEECVPYVENFMEYGVGKRWLKTLKLTLPKKEEKTEDSDKETFTITSSSAEKAKKAE